MRRAGGGGALVVLALVAGCSGQPSLEQAEPAVRQAVRVVVGPGAEVRRTVSSRCGPTDERLDGLRLQLVADVPPGSVDLHRAADELRSDGLDAEVGDGTHAPLLAVTSGSDWTAELWPGDDRAWRLTAVAEVDGATGSAGGAVQPCG